MKGKKATENKIALITGASTGIGKAIAKEFENNNYHLILLGRNIKKLKRNFPDANIIYCNLNDLKSIKKAVEKINTKINVLVNVAGVWHSNKKAYADTHITKTSDEETLEVLNTTIIGTYMLTKNLLPLMPKKAKIINISGTFENGANGWLHYYVAKKAIEDFTIGLSQELRENKIQVNCISPSDTKTPAYKKFFPEYYKDALEPTEIGKLALFLGTNLANHLTGNIITAKNQDTF